jgi:hypothetical protein
VPVATPARAAIARSVAASKPSREKMARAARWMRVHLSRLLRSRSPPAAEREGRGTDGRTRLLPERVQI